MKPRRVRRWFGVALLFATCLVLAGCAAQNAYREGETLLADGRLPEALERFDAAARLEPGSVPFRVAQSRTRERLVVAWLADADAARERGELDASDRLYRQVLSVSPANERALAGLRLVDGRRRLDAVLRDAEASAQRGDWDAVRARARQVLMEAPSDPAARALLARASDALEKAQARAAASRGQTLAAAYRKPITIEFHDAPLRTVLEIIARTSGLNFVFDKDVRGDQKTSIFLKNSTVEAAIRMVMLSNQLELRVLDANSVLVFPSTAAKQKELQELSVRTFYLSNADAKTVATTLKTLLKLRDVVADEKLNLVMVRDAPEALRVAEKLVAAQDVPEAEVMLEVEVLEVKRTRLLNLGVNWPDQISLTPLAANGSTLTLADLRHLRSNTIGATVTGGSVVAKNNDTDANILANPRIRARNREKAKIHIGERVPNITTTATATGFVSESVNYVDVGLKLDVEPTVYLDNEVAIKISLEVSNIISQIQTKSGTLAYQIGTRTASTVLRLKDGENQVLAGLINDEDRRSADKVPGLGDVPVVGRLFGAQSDDRQKTEIVLSITPRVVRNIPRPSAEQQEFESGTESNVGARAGGEGGAAPAAGGGAAAGAIPAGANAGTAPGMQPLQGQSAANSTLQTGSNLALGAVSPLPVGNVTARWTGPSTARRGDVVSLALMVQSDQPITGVPAVVGFDPQVFQVVDVVEGDWLRQNGATTSLNTQVDASGQVRLSVARAGDGLTGAQGDGLLATVRLKVASGAASGPSRVQLLGLAPVGVGGRAVQATLPEAFTVVVGD